MISLPQKLRKESLEASETAMDYQIVSIVLKRRETIRSVALVGGKVAATGGVLTSIKTAIWPRPSKV
jgi:hypothetical protein